MLNDPIQLIGPASPFGNSRETFRKSGTDGSNPVPSSAESRANRVDRSNELADVLAPQLRLVPISCRVRLRRVIAGRAVASP